MFADQFRAALKARGMLQKDVVEATGLSSAYVSLLATGRETPTPDRCREIAGVLGIDPLDLLAAEAVDRGRVELPAAGSEDERLELARRLVAEAEAARQG